MKVFFNALVIHLIFNIYVFIKGWQILPNKKSCRIPYSILFVLELIVYLVGFIFWEQLPLNILHPITLIGTSWMILIGYLSAFLLLYDLLKFVNKKIRKKTESKIYSLKTRKIYFLCSLLFVVAIMCHGNYKFKHPNITTLNLDIDKRVEGLDSLKIVMVGDVHVGSMIGRDMLKVYVDEIMAQKPDLILLVGDIIDYDLPPVVEQEMDIEFRRLKAPYGVFASTGNHEYRLNAEEKIAWLSNDAGLGVLRDSIVSVKDLFYVVGREDDLCPDRKNLKSILKAADKTKPIILMNHEPKRLYEESDEQVDLALYGHTHNGQLFPYNIVINWVYELGYGYKKKENTHMYVTSGVGLAGPQYRIGTLSEIVVINLSFKK